MDKIFDYINQKTDNAFLDIKIPELVYNKTNKVLFVKLVYNKTRSNITDEEKNLLNKLISEFLNSTVNIDLKVKKALLDEDVVKDSIYKFVQLNYSSVAASFSKNDINVNIIEDNIKISIYFYEIFYDFLRNKYFDLLLLDNLNKNFFESFEVSINKKANNSDTDVLTYRQEKVVGAAPVEEIVDKFIKVENVSPFIGNIAQDKPLCVKYTKTPDKNLCVAGRIRFITKRTFISKQKSESGTPVEKVYFSFVLYDLNGKDSLNFVYFINEKDIETFETLVDNSFIIVCGDLETFNERLNFKVKSISLASVVEVAVQEEVVKKKKENANYINVVPQPYIMLEQADLFSFGDAKTNEFLLNNDVVVFDLETTGLEASTNEIIEIGAVKIVQGKISETFSVLVKPKQEISEEITNITGINNDMVKDALSISDVLPDFYKFTRNCVLSAYNITFDYNFLYVASHNTGYVFDNRQIDAMYLAKTKLLGLKNYKLKTVAASLNIPLENAHRAINDAIATAEVFIKLSSDLK